MVLLVDSLVSSSQHRILYSVQCTYSVSISKEGRKQERKRRKSGWEENFIFFDGLFFSPTSLVGRHFETNPHNGIKREKGVCPLLFAATFVFVEQKIPREKNKTVSPVSFLLKHKIPVFWLD